MIDSTMEDIVELQHKLSENQRRIAEAAATNNSNKITMRTAASTPSSSRSKTIGELLSSGYSPSQIALHLGVPLSHVLERQSLLRSSSYERLKRKFLETDELEYPNSYVSYSIYQR